MYDFKSLKIIVTPKISKKKFMIGIKKKYITISFGITKRNYI